MKTSVFKTFIANGTCINIAHRVLYKKYYYELIIHNNIQFLLILVRENKF